MLFQASDIHRMRINLFIANNLKSLKAIEFDKKKWQQFENRAIVVAHELRIRVNEKWNIKVPALDSVNELTTHQTYWEVGNNY